MRTENSTQDSNSTDLDFDDLSTSEILGDGYQRKTRVRQPILPTKLHIFEGYPIGIYASLTCSDLQDLSWLESQQPEMTISVVDPSERAEDDEIRDGDARPNMPHTEMSLGLFPDVEMESDSQSCVL